MNGKLYGATWAGALTGIETHASSVSVTGNVISNYRAGMNITGIDSVPDYSVSVTGNTMNVTQSCIQIWSSNSHSGDGLNSAIFANNTCRVQQSQYQSASSQVFGIIFNAASNLPVRNVSILNNVITFDSTQGTASGHDNFGIGLSAASTLTLNNVVVQGNTIDYALNASIRFGGTNLILNGLRILDNTLHDGGYATGSTPLYSTPIFVASGQPANSIDISRNKIIDDYATPVIQGAFFESFPLGTTNVQYVDNTTDITNAPVSWSYFTSLDANTKPLVRMYASQPWNAAFPVAPGSTIYDATQKQWFSY